eukprot:TRINITY_DN7536_c0_g1_i1.p1 TRINITY_DN7536_c0_g1~~TRINITY_DN7536_c0_g1_i1.p1  ORF type:complete len:179 (+),score=25.07 TRINITY_DN7536_c0_g1_i1:228-764(+)
MKQLMVCLSIFVDACLVFSTSITTISDTTKASSTGNSRNMSISTPPITLVSGGAGDVVVDVEHQHDGDGDDSVDGDSAEAMATRRRHKSTSDSLPPLHDDSSDAKCPRESLKSFLYSTSLKVQPKVASDVGTQNRLIYTTELQNQQSHLFYKHIRENISKASKNPSKLTTLVRRCIMY